jgi:Ricin-type beta-trefoil lectin domain
MKFVLAVPALLLGTVFVADSASAQHRVKNAGGRCLHIPQESWSNGVQLRTGDCLDKTQIRWDKVDEPIHLSLLFMQKREFPYFWLRNKMTGKCAAVRASQKHDGAWVVQWDCRPEHNFQWMQMTDGQLLHRESGKCMHAASAGQYAPVTIRTCYGPPKGFIWGQMLIAATTARFLTNEFGKCLRANEGPLTTTSCRTTNDKLWTESTTSDGHSWFKNVSSGKCLAVRAGQTQEGAQAMLAECAVEPKSIELHWKWTPALSGLGLMHRASGKCLFVASGNETDAAILKTCPGAPNAPDSFKWRLT